jgi:hypothetical protein
MEQKRRRGIRERRKGGRRGESVKKIIGHFSNGN